MHRRFDWYAWCAQCEIWIRHSEDRFFRHGQTNFMLYAAAVVQSFFSLYRCDAAVAVQSNTLFVSSHQQRAHLGRVECATESNLQQAFAAQVI